MRHVTRACLAIAAVAALGWAAPSAAQQFEPVPGEPWRLAPGEDWSDEPQAQPFPGPDAPVFPTPERPQLPRPALPVPPQSRPENPITIWLSPLESGVETVSAAADNAGLARLIAPADGEYWLIVDGGPWGRSTARVAVEGEAMEAHLPACQEVCGPRVAPARFALSGGDEVEVTVWEGQVVITGDRLQRREYSPNSPFRPLAGIN